MSHPMNDELKERLYDEALEEVWDAFPKLSEELQDEIATIVAKDRWHNIDEEQSGYSPTPRKHYNQNEIDRVFKWLTKSPFIYKYTIDMGGKITLTFDQKEGGQ